MARKTVERNISYDDRRQLYYVSMELGRDENGQRIKQYRTYPTLAAARNGLKDFHASQEREAEPEDIPRACRLMYAAQLLALLGMAACSLAISIV